MLVYFAVTVLTPFPETPIEQVRLVSFFVPSAHSHDANFAFGASAGAVRVVSIFSVLITVYEPLGVAAAFVVPPVPD